MNRELQKHMGKRIRQARKKVGLSHVQLAELLGVDSDSVVSYETGRRSPHATDLPLLAEILNVSILYFFEGQKEDSDSASG